MIDTNYKIIITFIRTHTLLGGNYRYALTAIVCAYGTQSNVSLLHNVTSVPVLSIAR